MIKSVSIKYYKAIEDCSLQLQPFTVFIGNNGSGKSSVLEALRTLQRCLTESVEASFDAWGGIENVRNYLAGEAAPVEGDRSFADKASVQFALHCVLGNKNYEYTAHINLRSGSFNYYVEFEELICDNRQLIVGRASGKWGRNVAEVFVNDASDSDFQYPGNTLMLSMRAGNPFIINNDIRRFQEYIADWQFLHVEAQSMGKRYSPNGPEELQKLRPDGRNIAAYLLWIKGESQEAYESLIQKLTFVLPYMQRLQPEESKVFNREVFLEMYEQNDESPPLPGWLLSSGTLRVLALLAMFDTPHKPSVLFVDEIENGLDPRTIGLIINLIEQEFQIGEMQVVLTTHSPYLLDLVPLESIIVSEKGPEGGSTYHIPGNDEGLRLWRERFAPGKLYTMGKLTN